MGGCDRPQEGPKYGLCKSHAQRLRKTMNWDDLFCPVCRLPLPISSRRKIHSECTACADPDCSDPVLQQGYCPKHFMQWYRYGDNYAVSECQDCGLKFQVKTRGKKFCSDCERKHILASRIRSQNRRRSVQKTGDYYTIDMLLDLDGDLCYLCVEPLDDRPSVDHVIAIALGGTDTLDNLALTHLRCNHKKAAKSVEATMALFPRAIIPRRIEEVWYSATV